MTGRTSATLGTACTLLASMALWAGQALAEPGITDSKILIGQTADFSGPASKPVTEMTEGAKLYLDAVNRAGGVYGRKIELITEEFQDRKLYHNPKWTAEAMTDILENAVKYSPAGSSIKITLSRLDIYTKITIADEGIGIPKKEFNLIFQRFYRGKAVEQYEGSGLGLYLAQLILKCEKGYITVASEEGAGSRFSLFLLNETKHI